MNNLLTFLGDSGAGEPSEVLARTGEKAVWVLRKPEFSWMQQGAIQLTEAGYSLAADLGLLIAYFLRDVAHEVRWTVLRRPRSDASFNQPVLIGFGKLYLDPIRASITEALWALQHDGNSRVWVQIFEHWRNKALAAAASG